jgi:hypothetical protein
VWNSYKFVKAFVHIVWVVFEMIGIVEVGIEVDIMVAVKTDFEIDIIVAAEVDIQGIVSFAKERTDLLVMGIVNLTSFAVVEMDSVEVFQEIVGM